jgi:hypothetical protein
MFYFEMKQKMYRAFISHIFTRHICHFQPCSITTNPHLSRPFHQKVHLEVVSTLSFGVYTLHFFCALLANHITEYWLRSILILTCISSTCITITMIQKNSMAPATTQLKTISNLIIKMFRHNYKSTAK